MRPSYWYLQLKLDEQDPEWVLTEAPETWDETDVRNAVENKFHTEQPGKLRILKMVDAGSAVRLYEHGAGCMFCGDEGYTMVYYDGLPVGKRCPRCNGDTHECY